MIILDTNVLSALMRPDPEVAVLKWLDRQPESSIWTTSITLMEIRYGLRSMSAGRRREQMTQELEAVLREEIGERYIFFDIAAAEQAADLMVLRKLRGQPVELRDTMIAGIALATRATLATRNTSHFEDLSVPVINPWSS
ncbi:MAG: VapC toxin family PIN domain ribonuclease [Acidobacteria bacterium]|nr:MAG: VapC toxin family PIN domain ribonuclease [Acidobacteria bacterium 13_1_40CM_4_58_4]PYT63464.1 MAG: VapC toxin family PIN domain ribonuclease [Acidobacteriota bacterium]